MTISDVPEGAVEGVVRIVEGLTPDSQSFEEFQLARSFLSKEDIIRLQWILWFIGVRTEGDSIMTTECDDRIQCSSGIQCELDYECVLESVNEGNDPKSAESTESLTRICIEPTLVVTSVTTSINYNEFRFKNRKRALGNLFIDLKEKLNDDNWENLRQLLKVAKETRVEKIKLHLSHSHDCCQAIPKEVLMELHDAECTIHSFKGCIGTSCEELLAILRDRIEPETKLSLNLCPDNDFKILTDFQCNISEY